MHAQFFAASKLVATLWWHVAFVPHGWTLMSKIGNSVCNFIFEYTCAHDVGIEIASSYDWLLAMFLLGIGLEFLN